MKYFSVENIVRINFRFERFLRPLNCRFLFVIVTFFQATFQTDNSKSVQTDPRVRHARSVSEDKSRIDQKRKTSKIQISPFKYAETYWNDPSLYPCCESISTTSFRSIYAIEWLLRTTLQYDGWTSTIRISRSDQCSKRNSQSFPMGYQWTWTNVGQSSITTFIGCWCSTEYRPSINERGQFNSIDVFIFMVCLFFTWSLFTHVQVIESSLNADLPSLDEQTPRAQTRQARMPTEDQWRLYARDLQDTKEDLYFIDSLVHRGISKVWLVFICV